MVICCIKVTALDGTQRAVPEFETCKQIAQIQKIPLRDVYESILRVAKDT
jgi:uncharacterized protein (DUF111 family)